VTGAAGAWARPRQVDEAGGGELEGREGVGDDLLERLVGDPLAQRSQEDVADVAVDRDRAGRLDPWGGQRHRDQRGARRCGCALAGPQPLVELDVGRQPAGVAEEVQHRDVVAQPGQPAGRAVGEAQPAAGDQRQGRGGGRDRLGQRRQIEPGRQRDRSALRRHRAVVATHPLPRAGRATDRGGRRRAHAAGHRVVEEGGDRGVELIHRLTVSHGPGAANPRPPAW
jgi:hypothetical protein